MAVSGQTAKNIDSIIDKVDISKHKNTSAIVMHLGTNDIPKCDKQEVAKNCQSAINKLSKKWPKTPIAFSSIMPRVGKSSVVRKFNDDAKFVNNFMLENCTNVKYLHFIDNDDIFKKNGQTVKSL